MTNDRADRRARATAREAERYARSKRGRRIAHVDINEIETVEKLIFEGLLPRACANDARAVDAQLAIVFEHWLRS